MTLHSRRKNILGIPYARLIVAALGERSRVFLEVYGDLGDDLLRQNTTLSHHVFVGHRHEVRQRPQSRLPDGIVLVLDGQLLDDDVPVKQ